jgi:hypothetical protein
MGLTQNETNVISQVPVVGGVAVAVSNVLNTVGAIFSAGKSAPTYSYNQRFAFAQNLSNGLSGELRKYVSTADYNGNLANIFYQDFLNIIPNFRWATAGTKDRYMKQVAQSLAENPNEKIGVIVIWFQMCVTENMVEGEGGKSDFVNRSAATTAFIKNAIDRYNSTYAAKVQGGTVDFGLKEKQAGMSAGVGGVVGLALLGGLAWLWSKQ